MDAYVVARTDIRLICGAFWVSSPPTMATRRLAMNDCSLMNNPGLLQYRSIGFRQSLITNDVRGKIGNAS